MIEMKNSHVRLVCEPEFGLFHAYEAISDEAFFLNAKLGIIFKRNGKRQKLLMDSWKPYTFDFRTEKSTRHGPLKVLEVVCGGQHVQTHLHITFALPERNPIIFWKLEIGNYGSTPIELEQFQLFSIDSRNKGEIQLGGKGKPRKLAMYCNGWQSWSHTATYGAGERMRRSRLGVFQNPQNLNPTTPLPHKKGNFGSDFFAVIGDRISNRGYIVGFLSQKQQFGSVLARLEKHVKINLVASGDEALLIPNRTMETDWAVIVPIRTDDDDPLGPYVEAVARENDVKLTKAKPTGWCSWYEFYSKIDDEKINRNIKTIKRLKDDLPLDLVQIDDGFESQIGDWLEFKKTFPSGVKPCARVIHKSGMKAGLWLAPFIVHRMSKLMQENPEIILRKKNRQPVFSGINWNACTTALDLTNPAAIRQACTVIQTAVKDWGFEYLKLDFLYAGGLAGVHQDRSLTRAQILRKGMCELRDAAGEGVYLLGCGAPLGSMIGLVDGMRIGADVMGSWTTKAFGTHFIVGSEPNTPATINAIQNTLTRSALHNRWWINDPDVMLLRENMDLSLEEVRSLACVISLTGGMVMLSDDLEKLPAVRIQLAAKFLPALDQRPIVIDWFDAHTPSKLQLDFTGKTGEWKIISLSNWKDHPQTLRVALNEFRMKRGNYWLHSFWDHRVWIASDAKPIQIENVPPHSTLVLAVRECKTSDACYLGSDLHISQGNEVAEWAPRISGVDIKFSLPRNAEGIVTLALPRAPKQAILEGKEITWESDAQQIFHFPIRFTKRAKLSIEYTK
jgi:alpha-galactosidase